MKISGGAAAQDSGGLVWSQGRNHSVGDVSFDFRGDVRDLLGVQPQNVFLVEVSYWMSR